MVCFGKQQESNGWLIFTQQKNRNRKPVRLQISIHPERHRVIDSSLCGDLTFQVTEFNKSFSANGFGSWFRKRCNETGLPHCTSHGLHKAAATRLANHGATEHEIMSITGHSTSKEVTSYTKVANQKRLADGTIKLLGTNELDDPSV